MNITEIVDVRTPDSLETYDGWLLQAVAEIERAVAIDAFGDAAMAPTAAELLVAMHRTRLVARSVIIAMAGDDILGAGRIAIPKTGETDLIMLDLSVRPDQRRRGVGTFLLREIENRMRQSERSRLVIESSEPSEPPMGPGAMPSPAGPGRIRTTTPGALFALNRGFSLDQVSRHAILDLPVPIVLSEMLLGEALEMAGDDYRLVTWVDRAPEEWLTELAALENQALAPGRGAHAMPPWNEEVVRDYEQSLIDRGRHFVATAVEHVPTGTLAGFTLLSWPEHSGHLAFQEDTVVRPRHRGRKLGQLMKVANADALRTLRPTVRRVHTWNTEEDHYLHDVNARLGYQPAGVRARWAKRL